MLIATDIELEPFQWFKSRQKRALYEALEKIKSGIPSCGTFRMFFFLKYEPVMLVLYKA